MEKQLTMPDGYRIQKDVAGRYRWTNRTGDTTSSMMLCGSDGPPVWTRQEAAFGAIEHDAHGFINWGWEDMDA